MVFVDLYSSYRTLVKDGKIKVGEENDLPSETIPGQAVTAKEAVFRASRNLTVPLAREVVYDDDDGGADIDNPHPLNVPGMDKISAMDLVEAAKSRVDAAKRRRQEGAKATVPSEGNPEEQPSPKQPENKPSAVE